MFDAEDDTTRTMDISPNSARNWASCLKNLGGALLAPSSSAPPARPPLVAAGIEAGDKLLQAFAGRCIGDRDRGGGGRCRFSRVLHGQNDRRTEERCSKNKMCTDHGHGTSGTSRMTELVL